MINHNPKQLNKDTSSKQSLGESEAIVHSQNQVEGKEATSVSLAGQTDGSAPVHIIKHRKAKKLPVDVNIEELAKIMHVARHKHHMCAYLFAWYSSCRISEVLNIEPKDINFKEKTILIRQGKGNKDRIVPLPMHFREEHLYLLPLKKYLKARALQKAFRLDCKNAGIIKNEQWKTKYMKKTM